MFKFVKKGVFMLLVASLVMGVTSCKDDDPDYENVTPPVVEVAPSQIAGVVSAMNGDAIKDATVKATTGGKDVTATTDANGSYVLENVAKGTYTMEVAAEGKQVATGSLTVSKDGETVVYNAMLANAGKEVTVSATEDVVEETKTEVPEDNKEAEVTTEATIPAAAIDDTEAKIILTTVYTEGAATKGMVSKADTRAAKSTMLMGTDVDCSKEGVKLNKPITLSFDLGEEVVAVVTVKKNVNGSWETVNARKEGNKVTVDADEFGTYSVFADVDVAFSASAEAISFSQPEFDNLYGSKDMTVGNATYTYKQGGEINKTATGKLNAQLRQILAHQIQGNRVTTATGTYPLNVTLPVGTALTLTGSQTLTTVTASCGGKSASGKVYGSVSVAAATYNRQHTGGGNKPGA